MSTLRYHISQVRSKHRLLSDAAIPDRAIAAELRAASAYLINQKTNLRKYWNTDTIFNTIPCVEMQTVPIGECCDYASDKQISRSKLPLPKIGDGNYAYLIKGVFDIEGSTKLVYSDPLRYVNILKLKLPTKGEYYWIQNNYLYCTSPFVKVLKIIARFEEDIPKELLSGDCECTDRKVTFDCVNPLDLEFKCPSALESAVWTMTSQTLLSTYFNVTEDKTSDNKDDQTKNQR